MSKRLALGLILVFLVVFGQAQATPPTALCYTTTNGVCSVVSLTNPLPITTTGIATEPITFVTTGTSYTALSSDVFIAWNSASTGAKTQTIIAGSTTGKVNIVKDDIGTATQYPITLNCSGCTIDGNTTYLLNGNYQWVHLKYDGVSNWMVY